MHHGGNSVLQPPPRPCGRPREDHQENASAPARWTGSEEPYLRRFVAPHDGMLVQRTRSATHNEARPFFPTPTRFSSISMISESCFPFNQALARRCHQTLFFARIFHPFSTQLHFTFLTLPFLPYAYPCYVIPLMLSHSQTDNKNTIRLVLPDTEQLIYWATDIPKQSCCGSSSPGSCTGTSSAATERSHHSKFQTSRTQSTSRSASIARTLLVINRFLATTAARSP